jgi:WD40 repeat protein
MSIPRISCSHRFTGQLNESAWLRDSRHLVAAGDDGLVGIWDVLSGRLVTALPGASAAIRAIAVDASGQRIAGGDCDGNLHIWRAPHWEHNPASASEPHHGACVFRDRSAGIWQPRWRRADPGRSRSIAGKAHDVADLG